MSSPFQAARADSPVDFAREIRPILSGACFQCHGPDEKKREGGFRLDTKEGALGERKGRAAFVAGKPDKSEAMRRILSDDPDERMPPPDSGKKLTAQQIELLKKWVEQGAAWSTHWAFEPPRRPPLPLPPASLGNSDWRRNPIDPFVLARLEREQLSPSPEADKGTLLRRLYLDLIGLPPEPQEVDAFLADDRVDAYQRLVERLLASPHHGERWGRHWLDAARYADSDGYEKDKPRFVWFYRDWVISALNRDLPYDQFVIEQIAGDLLPQATQEQRVATGFLRNSMINEEGGIDPEQFRMEAMFDRMDAIGKSVLGLTIQCAQCHNHKYDPLTQDDYYRMFAFLNDCHEANIAVYTPEQQMQRAEIFRQIRDIETQLQHQTPDWPERMAKWEEQVRRDQPKWTAIQTTEDDPSGGQKMYRMPDGSYLCQGYAPTKHTVTVTVMTKQQNITALRLEQLNDSNLPMGGPGRSIKGTAALTEFKVHVRNVAKPSEAKWIKFVRATADVNPAEAPLEAIYDDKSNKRRVTGPVDFAVDGKDETAWSIDGGPGRRNVPRKAVFVADQPFGYAEGTEIQVHLVQNHGGWNSDDNQNHNLGRFRLAITSAKDPVADPLPAAVRETLSAPAKERSPGQTAAVFSYWRTTVPEWKEYNAKIESLWRQHPEPASQLALQSRDQPRTTHVLQRGDFLKPLRPVGPGVPAFLHPLSRRAGGVGPLVSSALSSAGANSTSHQGADAPRSPGSPNRLEFARWLVDRNSPTTARAIVNRVWQAYFGIGLVSTSEDLGSQSESPSHGELLDWLAVEFMDRGWSLKSLHRLIVTSATYRQSSHVTPESLRRDPYNRLLARGPRLRVEGEIVRDIALAASGVLNRQLTGPSVHPPAPDFLFLPPASYGPKVWKESQGADRYRRAVYTFTFRSVPFPSLQAFDAPNGDFSCVRRTRSNTPLQALTTLNEPLFMECAAALAEKTLREGGASDLERLTFAFRRCAGRTPSSGEATVLAEFLNKLKTSATQRESKPDTAAWIAVCRVLLNLDETITKE
jgi:hypothetical protein